MNIAEEIKFNPDKPAVVPIKKTEKVTIFAIGLVKDQILPKHKTPIPALLVVLKGEILFCINSDKIKLKELDAYQIPVDEEHEVIGVGNETIFLITKENK